VDQQEINLGGFGGELATSQGDVVSPTQRVDAQIPIKPGDSIYVEFRMATEDVGNAAAAASLGLVVA